MTHLGLLECRRTLGVPNTISLIRANLPAIADRLDPRLGLLAIGSDVLDSRLARRAHAETPFGAYADSLADAAFWTWYALRHEPSPLVRAAAVAAWSRRSPP